MRLSILALLLLAAPSLKAAPGWRIEAESPQTRILWRSDTLDITSPKGLSLWWEEPLQAPCRISYRASVVMEGGPCDRLSDLNCFWMASEPSAEGDLSPMKHAGRRGGRFVESYRLQCYYLGYGGNYNTTTRFRRYKGDTLAVDNTSLRPPVLTGYTDPQHLLRPNHWYDIRIEVTAEGRTRFFIDGLLLTDYLDPQPLRQGWFAFRTTWSHIRLTGWHFEHDQ